MYLAEDAGKADQYCEADGEYDRLSELHRLLYPEGADAHPGGALYYLLVCRVALGHHARSDSEPSLHIRVSGTRAESGNVGEVYKRTELRRGGNLLFFQHFFSHFNFIIFF